MKKTCDIGGIIRQIINNSEFTVQEISDKLKEMGYEKVSRSTIYGYENKVAMPNADVFLDICVICGCKNPLEFWKDEHSIEEIYSEEENEVISSYRKLSEEQKDMVLKLLDIKKKGELSSFQEAG